MVWGLFSGAWGGLGWFSFFFARQQMYLGYAACEEPDQIPSVMQLKKKGWWCIPFQTSLNNPLSDYIKKKKERSLTFNQNTHTYSRHQKDPSCTLSSEGSAATRLLLCKNTSNNCAVVCSPDNWGRARSIENNINLREQVLYPDYNQTSKAEYQIKYQPQRSVTRSYTRSRTVLKPTLVQCPGSTDQ